MKKLFCLSAVFIFIFASNAFSAKVYLKTDRTYLNLNETFSLTIVMENCSGDANLPDVDGLKILSSYSNSRVNIINGHMDKIKELGYEVVAVKKGLLKIPSFNVKTDKGIFATNSLELKVVEGKQSANVPGKDHIFFKTFLSRQKMFIGQKVFYKVIIYSDEGIVKLGFTKPLFKNFSSKRLPDKQYSQIVAGKAYSVNEITFSLIPFKASKGNIESASIEARVVEPSGRISKDPFFNDPFFSSNFTNTRRKFFNIPPVPYEIKALPENNSKAFSLDVIGKIKAFSSIDKKRLSINDSITYTLKISGEGNLSSTKFPDLIGAEGIKIYKDKSSSSINSSGNIEKGSVSQKYIVVASKNGEFEIPSFKVRYFDPENEKWKEIKIEARKFIVYGGIKNQAVSTGKPDKSKIKKSIINKTPANKESNDIISLKYKKGSFLSSKPDYKMFTAITLAIFISGCLLFCMKLLFLKYLKAQDVKKSDYLKDFHKIKNQNYNFIKKLENIKSLLNKASIDLYGLSFNSLIEFNPNNFDSDFIERSKKLLTKMEILLFSNLKQEDISNIDDIFYDSKLVLESICNYGEKYEKNH